MKAKIYPLRQWDWIDSAYWGLGYQKNMVYIGLCTHDPTKSAVFCSFDTDRKKIKTLFALSDLIGTKRGDLPQGKIHTPIYEAGDGNMYFTTHFAYPFGVPQRVRYAGGHIIRYHPKTETATDLGIPCHNEGLITMTLDPKFMMIYCLSAPSGYFLAYDVESGRTRSFGRVTHGGSICRSLVIDDRHNVYGSFENNRLFRFSYRRNKLEYPKTVLPDDSGSVREWRGPLRGGVNYVGRKLWRCAVFDKRSCTVFAVHASTMNLIAYQPARQRCTSLVYLGDETTRMKHDALYPTLSLTIHKERVFYALVRGSFDYCRSEGMFGPPSLLSFQTKRNILKNHGIIRGERNVYGIGGSFAAKNGRLYLLGAVERRKGERYNRFNRTAGKAFHLGLIEIDTTKLTYETDHHTSYAH